MGKKLTAKKIEAIIKKRPLTTFDICSVCGGVEESNSMEFVDETNGSFDLICKECSEKGKKPNSPQKKVVKRTFKIWTTIEEHIEFEDGSDDYRDIKDETVSAGEFSTFQEALLRNDLINETFGGDFTEE